MEQNRIINNDILERYIIEETQQITLNIASEKTLVIDVKSDVSASVIFNEMNANNDVVFNLEEGSKLVINLFLKNQLKTINIVANLGKNARIDAFCADFSLGSIDLSAMINLNGDNSVANWNLASLSANEDKKNISVSFNHIAENTEAIMNNYGVASDTAMLCFSGVGHIHKFASKTLTRQNAKIIVFDEGCDAKAMPILKIDENDVMASHAASVGKLNEEHMFYLCSRGLSVDAARKLITYGYLKPITLGFINQETVNDIISIIERRL